ncbi:MAG TPA: TonB-dependent receptor, partial [Cellvibrio sp.]
LGATGGIINFITQDTTSENKPATEFSSTINTTNDPSSATSGYKLGISHRVQQDAFSFLIAATREEQGLFNDGNGNIVGLEQVQGDIQDTRSHDLLLKAGYRWSQQELHLMVNDYEIVSHGDYVTVPGNIQTGVLTTAKPGNIQGDPPGNSVKNIALDYRNNQFGDAELSSTLFWQEFAATFGATNTAIFQDPSLGSGIYDQSQMRSEKYGVKFNFYQPAIAGTSLDLTTGLDFLDDKNSQPLLMTGRIWSPEMHFRNWSPFLQGDYHVTEKFTLNATLRQEIAKLDVDDYRTIATSGNTQVGGGELDFSETVYNLGAIYKLTPQWNLVFNEGEGFGMPDAGRELRAINKPGLQVEDIFAISPLVTSNREWGFFYAASNWQGQLSYFKSEADHGTQLQLIDNVYRLNRRPSETKGWELNTRWQVTENTLIKIMYADINGHYDSNGDSQLDSDLTALDIPPRRFIASWAQQWSNSWSAHLQWNYDASRKFQTRGTTNVAFEGYNLIDVGLTNQSRWGNFSVGVTNLTNRQYTTYFTQVVRRNDRFFAGQGRSFHLQYRVGF